MIKKSKLLILSLVLILALSVSSFAAVVSVTYSVFVGDEDVTAIAENKDGSTLLPVRILLEKFGFNVDWKPGVAKFTANNNGNLEELQKAVVRLYQGEKYIGNGFFVRKSKIVTTWTVKQRADGNQELRAKLYFHGENDEGIDLTNFRGNANRLTAMLDTKGFESDYIVNFAETNADKYTKTTLITANEMTGNNDLVPNQISVGYIKKINYEYNSNGVLYSLLNNNTDNRTNEEGNMSIGGLVVDAYGKGIGMFDKVEPGNNGNIFMTPISYIKMFLEDELD